MREEKRMERNQRKFGGYMSSGDGDRGAWLAFKSPVTEGVSRNRRNKRAHEERWGGFY